MADNNKNVHEFVGKVENYIQENSDSLKFRPTASILNKFLSFFKEQNKPLSEYSTTDFKKYLSSVCKQFDSSTTIRSVLVDVFKNLGEEKAADVLKRTPITLNYRYIKDFETLTEGIQKVRQEENSKYDESMDLGACDKFTLGEVVLYLLWIGVPRNVILDLPLSSIDLEHGIITSADKEYPFADNEVISKTLANYKNSDSFGTFCKRSNGKICVQFNSYYGDGIIRSRSELPKNSVSSKDAFISKVFSTFKFASTYLNVFRSGQFARGYEKYQAGQLPNYDSISSLWDYFRVDIKTADQLSSFRRDWNLYLTWRENQ